MMKITTIATALLLATIGAASAETKCDVLDGFGSVGSTAPIMRGYVRPGDVAEDADRVAEYARWLARRVKDLERLTEWTSQRLDHLQSQIDHERSMRTDR